MTPAAISPPMAPDTVIRVQELSKSFSDRKRGTVSAVDHISFSVNRGEIFGLLGPNGAGKTTTLRLLATLLRPTSGTAQLAGFDIVNSPLQVRHQIGFLSGEMGLYDRLTPRELLAFFGRIYASDTWDFQSRLEESIDRFGIKDFADVPISKLSTGMKQRTAIARAMLHTPPILILDEPAAGLDVPSAYVIEQSIVEARNNGACVVYSTHFMEEAEHLCDRIAVMHQGRIKITGTMEALRTATGRNRLREIFIELLGLRQS